MGNSVISKFVFMPPEPTYTEFSPYNVTKIPTKSGKTIPAYFLPAKNANTKTTIVYSHGNAADIGSMFDFLMFLNMNLEVNILHYEYIGYGLAKDFGPPSESSTYESIEAALDYLQNSHSISTKDCIIFGTSVGSGPSCHVASRFECKGLVLECPFTSCVRVVFNTGLGRPIDMFTNINKIPRVRCPVMIFHGREDNIVPFDHGVELWKKVDPIYKYRNIWVEGADHHTIIPCLTHAKYIEALTDFIKYSENFKVTETSVHYDRKIFVSNPSTDDTEFSVKPSFIQPNKS